MISLHVCRLVTLMASHDETPQQAIEEAFGGSRYVGYHTGIVLIKKNQDKIFRLQSLSERPMGIELPPCPGCHSNMKGYQKDNIRFKIVCTNLKCRSSASISLNNMDKYGVSLPIRKDLPGWRWVDANSTCWDEILLPWKIKDNPTMPLISKQLMTWTAPSFNESNQSACDSAHDSHNKQQMAIQEDLEPTPSTTAALQLTLKAMAMMQQQLDQAKNSLVPYGMSNLVPSSSIYQETLDQLQKMGVEMTLDCVKK
jgi:hypothetical protein